jgi:adenine-specific DNA-methyltransferase
MAKIPTGKTVEVITHDEASRRNIPTAEFQPVMRKEEQAPVRVTLLQGVSGLEEEKAGRNHDLDPRLVW